ncbi:unnamed protein product [Schistocephalus solidus]|uniref:C2H2-type domain-containing protein n=1 Tax=Schistocephalus solidus TaxID=70667 RepID=A0A183STN7_SCHSO|nr:unnamed protein product [Schistocephalus solidus]
MLLQPKPPPRPPTTSKVGLTIRHLDSGLRSEVIRPYRYIQNSAVLSSINCLTGTSRICSSVEIGNGVGLLMKSEEDAHLCSTKPNPFNFQTILFPDVSPTMNPKCEQYLSSESTLTATSLPLEDIMPSERIKRKFVEKIDEYAVPEETNVLSFASETSSMATKKLRNSLASGERDRSCAVPQTSSCNEYKRWLLPLKCRCERAFEEIEQFLAHTRECSTMLASVMNISHSDAICSAEHNQEHRLQKNDSHCNPEAEPPRSEDGSRSFAMDLTTRVSETHDKTTFVESSPTLICPECKVSTTNHIQLLRHFEAVHGVYGTFSCICGSGFEWLPAFLSHYLLCSMAATTKSGKEGIKERTHEAKIGNGKTCQNGSQSPVNFELNSTKLEYTPDNGKARFNIERQMHESPSRHKSPTGARLTSNDGNMCGLQNFMGKTASMREAFESPAGLHFPENFLLPTTELLRKVDAADSRSVWTALPKSFEKSPRREQKAKGKGGESEERMTGTAKTTATAVGGPTSDGNTTNLVVTDLSRPFKCCHCVKSFKSKALLDQHMHIHYPPKYTCRYCAKKYRWPPVFYHHQRTCKKRPPVTTSCSSSINGISTEALRTSASSGLMTGSHLYAPARSSTQHGQSSSLRFQLPGFPPPTSPLLPLPTIPSVSLPNPLLLYNSANPANFLGFPGMAEMEKQKTRPFFLPHPAVFGTSSWDKAPGKPSQPSPVTPPTGSAPMSPKVNTSAVDGLSPTERLFNMASAMVLQLPFPPPLGVNMDLFRLPILPPPPPAPAPALFPFFSRLPAMDMRPQQSASGPPQTSFEGNSTTRSSHDVNGSGSLRGSTIPSSMVAQNQLDSSDGVAESKMQAPARCTCGTEFDSLSHYLSHIGQCHLFGKIIPPPALSRIAQQQHQAPKTALETSMKGVHLPPPLPPTPFLLPPLNLDNAEKLFPFIGVDSIFPAMLQNSLKNWLPPSSTGEAGSMSSDDRSEESESGQKSLIDVKPPTDEPSTSTLTNMIMTMNAFIQSQKQQSQKGWEADAEMTVPNTAPSVAYTCSAVTTTSPQLTEKQTAKSNSNSTFPAPECSIPSLNQEVPKRTEEEKRLTGATSRRSVETSSPPSPGMTANEPVAAQSLTQPRWHPQEQEHVSNSSQTRIPDPTASLMMMTMANMFAKIATAAVAAAAPPASASEQPENAVSPAPPLPLLMPTQFSPQADLGFKFLPKFDLQGCAGDHTTDVFTTATTTATTTTNLCSKCGKEFSSRLSLKQHVEGKHSAEGKYQCPGCAKRYRWGASYYYHKKSCAAVRDSRSISSLSPPPPPQSSLLPSARTPNSSSPRVTLLESGFCVVSPSGVDASDESSSPIMATSELICSNPGEFLETGFERNFVSGQSVLRTTDEGQMLLLHSTTRLLSQEGSTVARTEEIANALGTEKSNNLVSICFKTDKLS